MKILTASALVCVIMALTAALPEASQEDDQTAKTELVKRWWWKKSCSRGWKLIKGRCFRYIPWRKSWAQAEKYCQSLNGHLASVHNIQEYYKIQRVIFTATSRYKTAWIGGSNAQERRIWLWSDGKSFNYVNWCHGQPNNFGNRQRCLQINFGGQKCWNDYGCFNRQPSVCAKNI